MEKGHTEFGFVTSLSNSPNVVFVVHQGVTYHKVIFAVCDVTGNKKRHKVVFVTCDVIVEEAQQGAAEREDG